MLVRPVDDGKSNLWRPDLLHDEDRIARGLVTTTTTTATLLPLALLLLLPNHGKCDGWGRRQGQKRSKKERKRQGCRRFHRRTVIGWVDEVGNGHRSPCFWVRILAVFGQGIKEKKVELGSKREGVVLRRAGLGLEGHGSVFLGRREKCCFGFKGGKGKGRLIDFLIFVLFYLMLMMIPTWMARCGQDGWH